MWFIKADERRGADGEEGGGGGTSLFWCLLLLIKERDYTLQSLFIHSVREKRDGERTSVMESCWCVLLLLLMCLLWRYDTSLVELVNTFRMS